MDDEPKDWRFFALFGVGGLALGLSVMFVEVLVAVLVLTGVVGLGWLLPSPHRQTAPYVGVTTLAFDALANQMRWRINKRCRKDFE